MRKLSLVSLAIFVCGFAAAQTPASSPYVSVVGTCEKVDAAGKVVSVKTDKGGETTVKFDDKTSFRRVPPGETDTRKATPAEIGDLAAGDRILARVHTENPTGVAALTFYIMKQAEIAQRNQKTLEEWQTQSVLGKSEIGGRGGEADGDRCAAGAGDERRDARCQRGGEILTAQFRNVHVRAFDHCDSSARRQRAGARPEKRRRERDQGGSDAIGWI